jgi:hypothetical protein
MKGGDLFLREIAKVDPATNQDARLLIDTNVVVEFMSFGDLLREGDKHRNILELMLFGEFSGADSDRRRSAEAAWRSPSHRHRQLRARASIVLMWTLAEKGIVAAMHGKEVLDILDKVSPVPRGHPNSLLPDGDSYALTTAIVHAVHETLIRRGLRLGALTEVNHLTTGNRADAELLRLAKRDSLSIISNEGYTSAGVSDYKANGSRSLRGLARDNGVSVYTPREFLDRMGVDLTRESKTLHSRMRTWPHRRVPSHR